MSGGGGDAERTEPQALNLMSPTRLTAGVAAAAQLGGVPGAPGGGGVQLSAANLQNVLQVRMPTVSVTSHPRADSSW